MPLEPLSRRTLVAGLASLAAAPALAATPAPSLTVQDRALV
jgi:hypothetical protein